MLKPVSISDFPCPKNREQGTE